MPLRYVSIRNRLPDTLQPYFSHNPVMTARSMPFGSSIGLPCLSPMSHARQYLTDGLHAFVDSWLSLNILVHPSFTIQHLRFLDCHIILGGTRWYSTPFCDWPLHSPFILKIQLFATSLL